MFNPQHQVLAAAGMVVFGPNIRGSSGFGRGFVPADDRYGRLDAIDGVAACAACLLELDVVDPDRVAVGGRSYGGYATVMAMARHPRLFAAGVDVCGMSDLLTFYRDTEPWIARAGVTKYGVPVFDQALLARLPAFGFAALRVSIADGLGKPASVSGLGLGDGTVALALAALIALLVAYLTLTGSDLPTKSALGEADRLESGARDG